MIPRRVSERRDIAFRLSRRFAGCRESVFRAWTDEAALRQWWCPPGWTPADIEIDLRVGGAYRIGMRKIETNKNVSVYGRFLNVRSPELLVYTWRWDGAFEEMPETRVTVRFSEYGDGTEVTLFHEHLPEIAVCLRHRAGWSAAWKRLESLLLADA